MNYSLSVASGSSVRTAVELVVTDKFAQWGRPLNYVITDAFYVVNLGPQLSFVITDTLLDIGEVNH
jgi:hypothetical protein